MTTLNETKQPIKGFKVTSFEGDDARSRMVDILHTAGVVAFQRGGLTLLSDDNIKELMRSLDERETAPVHGGRYVVAYVEGAPVIHLYTGDDLYMIESSLALDDSPIAELIAMINVQPATAANIIAFVFDFLYPLDFEYGFTYELPFALNMDRKSLLRTLAHNDPQYSIDVQGLFKFTLMLDGAHAEITITDNGQVTLKLNNGEKEMDTTLNEGTTRQRNGGYLPNSLLQATQYPGALAFDRSGQMMNQDDVVEKPAQVEYVVYCLNGGEHWTVWVGDVVCETGVSWREDPAFAVWYAGILSVVHNDRNVNIKLPSLPNDEIYRAACLVSNEDEVISDVILLDKECAVVALAAWGKLLHLSQGSRAALINDPKVPTRGHHITRDSTGVRIAELYHLRKEIISGARKFGAEKFNTTIHNHRGRDRRSVSGMEFRGGDYRVDVDRTSHHHQFKEQLLGDNVKMFLFTEDSKDLGRMKLSETFEAAPYSNRVNGSIDEYINQALQLDDPSLALDVVHDTLHRVASNIKALNEGIRLMTVLTNYLTNQQAEIVSQREIASRDEADSSGEPMLDNLSAGISDSLILVNTVDTLLKDNQVAVARKLEALAMIDKSLNTPLGRGSELNQVEAVVGALLTSALEISVLCSKLNMKKPEFQKKTGWRKFFG